MPGGRMHLLSYELRPTNITGDRAGIGGAFVICWLMADSIDSGRAKAQEHLEGSGWAVIKVVDERAVVSDQVPADAVGYYRQAQMDGEVYVIHAFPPDLADA